MERGVAMAELAVVLPVLLMIRKTRSLGLVASLALIVAIEIGAREFVFGLIFVSMVLLFARRDRLTPAGRGSPCPV